MIKKKDNFTKSQKKKKNQASLSLLYNVDVRLSHHDSSYNLLLTVSTEAEYSVVFIDNKRDDYHFSVNEEQL